jgi:hypothetical protein
MLQLPYCIESMPNGSEGHSCEQSALKKIREPNIKREFFFIRTTATAYIVLQCSIISLRFKESQEYTNCYKIKRIRQKSRSELQMKKGLPSRFLMITLSEKVQEKKRKEL